MGSRKYSDEQELQIIKEYREGTPVAELMARYGYKTKKSITDKIKKHFPEEYNKILVEAAQTRKGYSFSFKEISSSFHAYLLGLLLTDGYILSDRDGFGLDMTDEDVVKFVADSIGTNYKSYQIEGKKDKYRVLVNMPGITKELERLGIVPRKSKILQPPQLTISEEKYLPYIIRGIIDGDGCISATSYGAPLLYICSASKDFIDWLDDILTNRFFITNLRKYQSTTKLWKIETADQNNILKIIALIYNSPYGMNRKYHKIKETFRDYNGTSFLER